MKKIIRNTFILLTIVWMIIIFIFSSQESDISKNTSSFVTRKVVKVIYGDILNEDEFYQKVQEWDYVVRKLAHYTMYLCGGVSISAAIYTYEIDKKKSVFIAQGIREFLCSNRRNTSILCSTVEVARLKM